MKIYTSVVVVAGPGLTQIPNSTSLLELPAFQSSGGNKRDRIGKAATQLVSGSTSPSKKGLALGGKGENGLHASPPPFHEPHAFRQVAHPKSSITPAPPYKFHYVHQTSCLVWPTLTPINPHQSFYTYRVLHDTWCHMTSPKDLSHQHGTLTLYVTLDQLFDSANFTFYCNRSSRDRFYLLVKSSK